MKCGPPIEIPLLAVYPFTVASEDALKRTRLPHRRLLKRAADAREERVARRSGRFLSGRVVSESAENVSR
uniref:Uncharacterized protein n=1 Tax=Anguilla anguilla TaxID=7936 RepID=A0A0E9RZ64_ANGAN